MKKPLGAFVAAILLTGLASAPVYGEALLRITPDGSPSYGYEETGADVGPVFIESDGFRLTFHGGGSDTLENPVLLIIGVPDTSMTAPIISANVVSGIDSVNFPLALGDPIAAGGSSIYNGFWDTGSGFAGTFDADGNSRSGAPNPKVYDFIGLAKGSNSENYTNWSTNYNELMGTSGTPMWNLFVYQLSFSPEMAQSDYVEFATSLPVGSYVIGYGCTSTKTTSTGSTVCGNAGATESTPFTFAGLVTTRVPEPSTLSLLLPALGLFLSRNRKRKSAHLVG